MEILKDFARTSLHVLFKVGDGRKVDLKPNHGKVKFNNQIIIDSTGATRYSVFIWFFSAGFVTKSHLF